MKVAGFALGLWAWRSRRWLMNRAMATFAAHSASELDNHNGLAPWGYSIPIALRFKVLRLP